MDNWISFFPIGTQFIDMQIVNAVNIVHNCLCSLQPRSHSQLLSILWKCDIQLEESSSHCILGRSFTQTECFRLRWHLYEISSWFFHLKDRTLQQSCNQFSNIPFQRLFLYTSKKFYHSMFDIRITAIFHVMEDLILHSRSKVKIFLMPFSLSCAIKTTLMDCVEAGNMVSCEQKFTKFDSRFYFCLYVTFFHRYWNWN